MPTCDKSQLSIGHIFINVICLPHFVLYLSSTVKNNVMYHIWRFCFLLKCNRSSTPAATAHLTHLTKALIRSLLRSLRFRAKCCFLILVDVLTPTSVTNAAKLLQFCSLLALPVQQLTHFQQLFYNKKCIKFLFFE